MNEGSNQVDDVRPPDEHRGIQEPLLPPAGDVDLEDAQIPENQMFFPWFDRQEIRDGNYYNAQKLMKCYGMIWGVFALVSLIRIKDCLSRRGRHYTADIYVTENFYFMASQFSFLALSLNCLYSHGRAYYNPKVLLRARWQKWNRNKMYGFIALWLFVLLNSFVLFLWNFLTEAVDPIKKTNPRTPPTKVEQGLSSELHTDIIINLAFIAIVGYFYYKIWARKRDKKQTAERLLSSINQMTKQWSEIQPQLENPDAEAAGPTECCICMDTYQPESLVIQLKCHPSHVYHLECFSKFVEGIAEDIGQAKCPLCQQEIEFN